MYPGYRLEIPGAHSRDWLVCCLVGAVPDGETIPKFRRDAYSAESSSSQFCRAEGIYFKQLLAGRDFAKLSTARNSFEKQLFKFSAQMKNYVYLIGDLSNGETVVVDGCWDVRGIKRYARNDGMKIKHYVATHYHYDHIGGQVDQEPFKSQNIRLPGLQEFVLGLKKANREKRLNNDSIPALAKPYISNIELEQAAKQTSVPKRFFIPLEDFSTIDIGNTVRLTFRHTPGHSPGSMVILVSKIDADDIPLFMVSGDTLFPGSCGRVDLPESNHVDMWDSLKKLKVSYNDDLLVFPGHGYSKPNTTIGEEKRIGLLGITKSQWMSGRKKKVVDKINVYRKK